MSRRGSIGASSLIYAVDCVVPVLYGSSSFCSLSSTDSVVLGVIVVVICFGIVWVGCVGCRGFSCCCCPCPGVFFFLLATRTSLKPVWVVVLSPSEDVNSTWSSAFSASSVCVLVVVGCFC